MPRFHHTCLVAPALLLLAGCVQDYTPPRATQVIVQPSPQPPPQTAVVDPVPRTLRLTASWCHRRPRELGRWSGGRAIQFWRQQLGLAARCDCVPPPGATTWVPGRWAQQPTGGWTWLEGHWA